MKKATTILTTTALLEGLDCLLAGHSVNLLPALYLNPLPWGLQKLKRLRFHPLTLVFPALLFCLTFIILV